jgi:hypothetical protein
MRALHALLASICRLWGVYDGIKDFAVVGQILSSYLFPRLAKTTHFNESWPYGKGGPHCNSWIHSIMKLASRFGGSGWDWSGRVSDVEQDLKK